MARDEMITAQANRIVVTLGCIIMYAPELRQSDRFREIQEKEDHARGLAVDASLDTSNKREANTREADAAYRHVANEYDVLLWTYITDESEEWWATLDELATYPDQQSKCLGMRKKLKDLEEYLNSRDMVITVAALQYGELKRQLNGTIKAIHEVLATRIIAVA